MKPPMSFPEAVVRMSSIMVHAPIVLLPCELQHPAAATTWALACIGVNVGERAKTDPYGGTECAILDDQGYFARYLVALARLTPEGQRIVKVARGEQEMGQQR